MINEFSLKVIHFNAVCFSSAQLVIWILHALKHVSTFQIKFLEADEDIL